MENSNQPDTSQNAARIVQESTASREGATPDDLEAAWLEWSKGMRKVDDRTRTLLRAAFEAGADAAVAPSR